MTDSPKKPVKEGPKKPAKETAPNFRAFTLRADRPQRKIQFHVGITQAMGDDKGVAQSQLRKYTAVLDTAASRTRVSRRIIEAVGLKPGGGNGHAAHYCADIYLPNMIRFAEVPVTEIPPDLDTEADCLIGMDILSCADCSLSHHDRKMMFSFRVPPLGTTDFVQEHQRLHKGSKRMVTTAATRNQPCPCGSGKRFKNCCGRIH